MPSAELSLLSWGDLGFSSALTKCWRSDSYCSSNLEFRRQNLKCPANKNTHYTLYVITLTNLLNVPFLSINIQTPRTKCSWQRQDSRQLSHRTHILPIGKSFFSFSARITYTKFQVNLNKKTEIKKSWSKMCDFLPSSVHKILDDVEFSLSLPILLVIAMCTVHLAVNHSMHIACNVKEIMRKRSEKRKKQRKCVKEGPGMMERIKGLLVYHIIMLISSKV